MDLQMQKGNQNAQSNKLWPVINFLKKTISLDIPANTVIFIDTHACANTGCLQYGGGRAAPLVVDVNQVSASSCFFLVVWHSLSSWQLINGFIGQPFLECMAAASKLGSMLLANSAMQHSRYPGVKINNPGGLSILIILSCGPCFTNPNHLRICKKEVEK